MKTSNLIGTFALALLLAGVTVGVVSAQNNEELGTPTATPTPIIDLDADNDADDDAVPEGAPRTGFGTL
jgi:hypothetical protein